MLFSRSWESATKEGALRSRRHLLQTSSCIISITLSNEAWAECNQMCTKHPEAVAAASHHRCHGCWLHAGWPLLHWMPLRFRSHRNEACFLTRSAASHRRCCSGAPLRASSHGWHAAVACLQRHPPCLHTVDAAAASRPPCPAPPRWGRGVAACSPGGGAPGFSWQPGPQGALPPPKPGGASG